MSLPVNSKFTKIDKNVKYALECSERLVFKPFLVLIFCIIVTRNGLNTNV